MHAATYFYLPFLCKQAHLCYLEYLGPPQTSGRVHRGLLDPDFVPVQCGLGQSEEGAGAALGNAVVNQQLPVSRKVKVPPRFLEPGIIRGREVPGAPGKMGHAMASAQFPGPDIVAGPVGGDQEVFVLEFREIITILQPPN